jgi:hypothetical protein
MLVLFGAPYLVAWYFFFSGTSLEVGNPSNKGNLVSPIRPLPDMAYQLHDGSLLAVDTLQDHWLMISVAAGCDELCEQALIIMQQSRRAQAVNRRHIQRLLVLTAGQERAQELADLYQGTLVITGDVAAVEHLTATFAGLEKQLQGSIYLVDPRLNVMMSYNAELPRNSLLKDMERLFKVINM